MLFVCSYHNVSTTRIWLIQSNNSWNSMEANYFNDLKINFPISLQNIRRYVVSWILVVVVIVMIQLMVLFDVIHVVNTKNSEASDKSFMYTALEVFCLGESTDLLFISTHTRCNVWQWKISILYIVSSTPTSIIEEMIST